MVYACQKENEAISVFGTWYIQVVYKGIRKELIDALDSIWVIDYWLESHYQRRIARQKIISYHREASNGIQSSKNRLTL